MRAIDNFQDDFYRAMRTNFSNRRSFFGRWLDEILALKFGYVRNCGYLKWVAPIVLLKSRVSVPLSEHETYFLAQCAERDSGIPDYSSRVTIPPLYSAMLRNAVICGRTGGVIYADRLIIDSLQHLKTCIRSPSYRTISLAKYGKRRGLFTSIFYLPEGENVYHWLCDCLPRLYLLTLVHKGPITLLCHDMSIYQAETLKIVLTGLPEIRIVKIKNDQRWQLENYLFLSFPSELASGVVQADSLMFVRNALRSCSDTRCKGPQRIFISRARANERKIINEDELIQALIPLGFVPIVAEELTVYEQISFFRNAKCIVGAHGAGLTNMLFADRPVTVELCPKGFWRSHFCLLAKAINGGHYVMHGGEYNRENAFRINSAGVVEMLQRIFSNTPRLI